MKLLDYLPLCAASLAGLTSAAPMDGVEIQNAEPLVSRDTGLTTITKRDLTSEFIDQSVYLNHAQSAHVYSATPYLREGVVQYKFKIDGIAEGLAMNASTSINLAHDSSSGGPNVSVVPVEALDPLSHDQGLRFTSYKAQVIAVNFQTTSILYHILPENGQVQKVQGDVFIHNLDRVDRNAPPDLIILVSLPGLSARAINDIPLLSTRCFIACQAGQGKVDEENPDHCPCEHQWDSTAAPQSNGDVTKAKRSDGGIREQRDGSPSCLHDGCPNGMGCRGQCAPHGGPVTQWQCIHDELIYKSPFNDTKRDEDFAPVSISKRTVGPPVNPCPHRRRGTEISEQKERRQLVEAVSQQSQGHWDRMDAHIGASDPQPRALEEVDQYSAIADPYTCQLLTCIVTKEPAMYNPYLGQCFCGTDPTSRMVRREEVES